MANRYFPSSDQQLTQNYQRYFSSDPNVGYSFYKDEAQNASLGLYYETSIGRIIINRLTTKVIGNGLVPMASPETSVLGWDKETTERFQRQVEAMYRIITESSNFDYRGKTSLKEHEAIAFKTILTSGDILLHRGYRRSNGVVSPYIQIISGKLVGNPGNNMDTKSITGGVKLDTRGRELGYYIMVTDANRQDTFDYQYVSRINPRTGHKDYDLITLAQAESNQIRGVPYLTSLKDDILQLVKLKDLHLTKAIIQTLFTIAIEKDKDSKESTESFKDKLKYGVAGDDNELVEIDNSGSAIRLEPGLVVELEDGQHMKAVETALNSTDFAQAIKTNLELIGAAVGLPYEELLGSYNSSFSASRATINDSEKYYRSLRNEFISKFMNPIYEHVVDYCITAGLVEAPGYFDSEIQRRAVLACTWTGTTPTQVDPVKEVNAYATAISNGLCTREYATRSLYGMDFDEVAERLTKEAEMLSQINPQAETANTPSNTENTEDEEEQKDEQ